MGNALDNILDEYSRYPKDVMQEACQLAEVKQTVAMRKQAQENALQVEEEEQEQLSAPPTMQEESDEEIYNSFEGKLSDAAESVCATSTGTPHSSPNYRPATRLIITLGPCPKPMMLVVSQPGTGDVYKMRINPANRPRKLLFKGVPSGSCIVRLMAVYRERKVNLPQGTATLDLR